MTRCLSRLEAFVDPDFRRSPVKNGHIRLVSNEEVIYKSRTYRSITLASSSLPTRQRPEERRQVDRPIARAALPRSRAPPTAGLRAGFPPGRDGRATVPR